MNKNLLYILIVLILSCTQILAQDSRDNFTGTWSGPNSWTSGTAPPVTGIASNINIRGYITRDGHLDFAANNSTLAITIYDTLVVKGNMTFNNNAQDLVVRAGAVLIVLGNFNATNKIDLSNGGIFVVKGSLTFSNSGQDQYLGNGELFVQGGISGSNAATTANKEPGGLAAKYPAIADFVAGNTNSLPVKLLNFSATRSNGTVLLSWSTVNEKNFDYFTIERSSDFKTFKSIGTIKGGGNSSSIIKYEFYDHSPLTSDAYYRLKATDFDGTHEYHQVIKLAPLKKETASLSVYPNPLSGRNFKLQTSFDKGTIKVYSILGKEVYKSKIEPGIIYHLEKLLDPGLYIVIAENGSQKLHTKLTVK